MRKGGAGVTIAYSVFEMVAVLLLVGYVMLVKKKDPWLLFLFCCVPVVNLGYLLLSLTTDKVAALVANHVAYFGSVFLSLCMFMVIFRLCGYTYKRWFPVLLLGLALLMFGAVCSPWYYNYAETTFTVETGLQKVYGPLHNVYAVYLFGYFVAMIVVIFRAMHRRQVMSCKAAVLMTGIVLGNLTFWLIQKFVPWNFEFLSVSYLFSEIVLLGLYWMLQDYVHISYLEEEDKLSRALRLLPPGVALHPREEEVLKAVLENKKRKDIAIELNLSENTVKTYTRNLYRKLGVASREELYTRV